MASARLAALILAIALQACCYVWFGVAESVMFAEAHAPVSVIMSSGVSLWFKALLLFAAAIAYAFRADLRPFLQVLAALGGVYGLVLWSSSRHFGHSWYIFGGDLIALGFWSLALFLVIAVLGIADAALTRFQHNRRMQAFRS